MISHRIAASRDLSIPQASPKVFILNLHWYVLRALFPRCLSAFGNARLEFETELSDEPLLAVDRNLLLAILRAVVSTSIMSLFEETGAYLRGHFRLTSGLHSGEYLQCAKVLAVPAYAERLGRELAGRLKSLVGGASIDVVVSPAIGGIIIGYEVARAFEVPSFFTERDPASPRNEMTLRRGFEVTPGQRAVVIEDVVTTGGSTREVIRVLRDAGAVVLAAGSIIDRSGGQVDFGVPRLALETLHPTTYDPGNCPLCNEGQPLIKPGSRPA